MFWKCAQRKCEFRMDRREGPGGHRGGEDGGFISEPKAVEKSKEGGLSDGFRSYTNGDGELTSVPEVVEGECNQSRPEPGDQCGRRGVRRLKDGESWVKCADASHRTMRWVSCTLTTFYTIDEQYWIQEGEHWKERTGPIPKEASEIYVIVKPDRRGEHEMDWGDDRNRQLSRKERQLIEKAMKKAEAKLRPVAVGELYSPPRISNHLKKKGLEVGTSFDLLTRWDLAQEDQKRSCEKRSQRFCSCRHHALHSAGCKRSTGGV